LTPTRRRLVSLVALPVVILLGLASRRYAAALPRFVAAYAGDTLWALMIFVGITALAPAWTTLRAGSIAFAICAVVELGQLYHAPWIDALRRTRLGGWALGYGFLWSDLACYATGVALGVIMLSGARKLTPGSDAEVP
jgi:hypothetical protein